MLSPQSFCRPPPPNPCCINLLQKHGGKETSLGFEDFNVQPLKHFNVSRSIPFLFIFLRTLLRFFAFMQNSTLLFSSGSALFTKNTRGGGCLITFDTGKAFRGDCPKRK